MKARSAFASAVALTVLAACSSPARTPEAALAHDILSGRSQPSRCGAGEFRYCEGPWSHAVECTCQPQAVMQRFFENLGNPRHYY